MSDQPQDTTYQARTRHHCKKHGFTGDPMTLALLLCKTVGDTAHSVLHLSSLHESGSVRVQSDIEDKLALVLTCLCTLANAVEVDLGI